MANLFLNIDPIPKSPSPFSDRVMGKFFKIFATEVLKFELGILLQHPKYIKPAPKVSPVFFSLRKNILKM